MHRHPHPGQRTHQGPRIGGHDLLGDHLTHCVMDAATEDRPVAEAKVKEASDVIARLVRS